MSNYSGYIPKDLAKELLSFGMPLYKYAVGSYDGNDMWRYACYGKRDYVAAKSNGWIKSANDAIHCILEHLI